jgi:hypothetical protein
VIVEVLDGARGPSPSRRPAASAARRATRRLGALAAGAALASSLLAGAATPASALPAESGRLADSRPFYGGALYSILIPGDGGGVTASCTTAFSFQFTDGGYGALTAGHCADGTASSSPVGTRDDAGAGSFQPLGDAGDVALVRWNGHFASAAWMYQDEGRAQTSRALAVLGVWTTRSRPGERFCIGGGHNGDVCAYTVLDLPAETRRALRIPDTQTAGILDSARYPGGCPRPGDSGAPVYTLSSRGVWAKGVLAGRIDDARTCVVTFTDVALVAPRLPGRILTTTL